MEVKPGNLSVLIIGIVWFTLYLTWEFYHTAQSVEQPHIKRYGKENGNSNTSKHAFINAPISSGQHEIEVVIGIFSRPQNFCLREALRKTFMFKATRYKYFVIRVFFLIDLPNEQLNIEQINFQDIIYFYTKENGWDKHFAKKLHMWISYVVNNFPKTALIGKIDDDIFACTPQVFDRLHEVMHPLLYYGYPTGAGFPEAVDDMFMFLGIELARRISKQKVCENATEKHCLHDGNGAHMFRQWISNYKDIEFVDEKDNNKMIWFYQGTSKDIKNTLKLFRTNSFCDNYLVYHKASHHEIYRMAKWNVERLGETDVSDFKSNSSKCAYNAHQLP